MATGGALFELEDQQWFPMCLRRMQVEYIGWLAMNFKIYRPLAPVLREAVHASGADRVIDIGSGNGGPIMDLARSDQLNGIEFLLTDRFPAPFTTGSSHVKWLELSVDALSIDVPSGFRTFFNVFHHFSEAEKQQLLKIHGKHGLLIAEILQPDLICFLQILLATTIGQVVLCPFVRPFRWERLLFTWLIPINILTVAWDGLVSVIRVDRASVLADRARKFAPAGAKIESGGSGPWWKRVSWVTVIPAK